jgi:hypothetical protein
VSTRSNIRPQSVILNGDMSLASLTSAVTILQSLTLGSYTYSWSGATPVGTISVEVSNDYSVDATGAVKNAGTWTAVYFTLNGATVVNSAPVSGNTGNGIIEWSTGAYAIRTKYTKGSGTGTLQAVVNGKVA